MTRPDPNAQEPSGLYQMLVRCSRCEARNVVDIRRQGLRQARCGRCGEPLPRRLPAPLLLLAVTGLLVVFGLTHLGIDAVRKRQEVAHRARAERLIEEGRASEAVSLVPRQRTPGSEGGLLARRVAESLAAPVLAADRDAAAGPFTVEEAVGLGDELIEKHESDLPELLQVLDEPLRRLQARRIAFEILEPARALAEADPPDLARVDRALADATMVALEAPPDVAAAVELLAPGIRGRAALALARRVVTKRPEEARQILNRAAQRMPVRESRAAVAEDSHGDMPEGTLVERVASIERAVAARDAASLSRLVHARAEASWPDAAHVEMDAAVRRACEALASLQSEAASRAWDPAERASLLLSAMTCDEILPRAFLRDARAAVAETLTEAARRGGDLDQALDAWVGIASPRRDRDLAALGCLAEARGAHAAAVRAWAATSSPAALSLLARCAEEAAEAAPPATIPALAYPSDR